MLTLIVMEVATSIKHARAAACPTLACPTLAYNALLIEWKSP
jgi:hypothetical protein